MRPSPLKHVLAVLRTTIGLTQKEMAALLGVSTPTIQAIELGKLKLSDRLAEKICYETGVNSCWILSNDVQIPPYRYSCTELNAAPFAEQYEIYRANLRTSDILDADKANLCFTMTMEGVAELILSAYAEGKLPLCMLKLDHVLLELRKTFPWVQERVPHTRIRIEGSKTMFDYANIADVVAVFREQLAKMSGTKPKFPTGHFESDLSEVQKGLLAKRSAKSGKHSKT